MIKSNYRVDRCITDDDSVVIVVKCPFCGKESVFDVDKETWYKGEQAYKNGALIQNAWPTLSPAQRELLITGMCEECWDNM